MNEDKKVPAYFNGRDLCAEFEWLADGESLIYNPHDTQTFAFYAFGCLWQGTFYQNILDLRVVWGATFVETKEAIDNMSTWIAEGSLDVDAPHVELKTSYPTKRVVASYWWFEEDILGVNDEE